MKQSQAEAEVHVPRATEHQLVDVVGVAPQLPLLPSLVGVGVEGPRHHQHLQYYQQHLLAGTNRFCPADCPAASHPTMRLLSIPCDAHAATNALRSTWLLRGHPQPLQCTRNRCSHAVPIDAPLTLGLSAQSSSTSSSPPEEWCHLLVPAPCKARETVAGTTYSPSQCV